MKLEALRARAAHALAAGDAATALGLYSHIVRRQPTDLDARLRAADACVALEEAGAARRIYAAVATLDLKAGRPLHALIAMQALADLGENVTPLYAAMASIYGAASPRLARVGARLSPPAPDCEIDAPDGGTLDVGACVDAACDAAGIASFPPAFQAVPLLSELTEAAFLRVLAAASVRRLEGGDVVVRQGDPGHAFYFIASGQVRVSTVGADGEMIDLGRLHEGSIFGEMALIRAEPRSASVDVVGGADLIEFGRSAILAAVEELPALASALERFARDRLIKTLLHTSPLFAPFDATQRLELLRHFTGQEVAAHADVIRRGDEGRGLFLVLAGEMEVVAGGDEDGGSGEHVVALLGPGELFGEISLLDGRPAIATVRATRPGQVLFLAREYFERLVRALPSLRGWFEALSAERLEQTAAVLQSFALDGLRDEEPLF